MPILNTGLFKTHIYNQSYVSDADAIHYIKRKLKYCDENDILLPGKFMEDNESDIKLFNWYIVNYTSLENFIVCKSKDYDTEESIYIIFDIYHYYLCEEDLITENINLQHLKNNIDKYNTGKYIIYDNFKIITNESKIQKYYNFKHNINTKELHKNLYLFMTPFRITKPDSEYNHNFNQYRWFYIINNIDPSGSYKINYKNLQYIKPNEDFMYKTYYCADPLNLFKNQINDDRYMPISRVSLDIECKHFGVFPTPDKFPISHICIEWLEDGKKICKKKIIVLINHDIISEYKGIKLEKFNVSDVDAYMNDKNIYHFIYASERYLLDFIQYILLTDFDYILTFNGHSFDFMYIQKRREYYAMNKLFTINVAKQEPILIIENRFQDVRHDIKTNNSIIFLDIYNYIKKFYRDSLSSFKLEVYSKIKFNIDADIIENADEYIICPSESNNTNRLKMFYNVLRTANYCFINDIAFEIKDKSKIIQCSELLYNEESIDNSVGKSFTIYKKHNEIIEKHVEICLSKDDVDIGDKNMYKNYTIDTAKKIGYYCVHDTVLCNKHFEVDMIDYKIRAFSTHYYLPQHNSLSYKGSTNSLGQILYILLKNKMMIKTGHTESNTYDGGKVFKPKRTHIVDPTLIFDFKSLYPTLIIEANLSPEKIEKIIISNDKITNEYIEKFINKNYKYPDYCHIRIDSKDVYTYIITNKDEPGIITEMLIDGMHKRNIYKSQMKKNSDNYILYSLFDSLQYSTKIMINSIYGLLGSDTFIFKSKYCAQFCTALGQKCIKYVYNLLDNCQYINNTLNLNSELNIFTNTLVKTNYTGSINIDFDIDIIYGDTDSLFVNIKFRDNDIDDKQKLRYAIEIGKFISNIINNNNIFPKLFELEFEDVNKWMIIIAKKKYIAEKIKNFDTLELKFVTKGTALIRRDYTQFHKSIIKNTVDIIKSNISQSNIDKKLYEYYLNVFGNCIQNINKLDINNFVRTMKYASKYKNSDHVNERKVREYNSKNPNNMIVKGERFSFVYGKIIDKWDDNTLKWDKNNTNNISEQILILENNKYNNNVRICIEKYIKNVLTDLNPLIMNKNIIPAVLMDLKILI
jgi:DNA polymerase elongation subunit (family B)